LVEHERLAGQAIDRGRLDPRVAVSPKIARVQPIKNQTDYIHAAILTYLSSGEYTGGLIAAGAQGFASSWGSNRDFSTIGRLKSFCFWGQNRDFSTFRDGIAPLIFINRISKEH